MDWQDKNVQLAAAAGVAAVATLATLSRKSQPAVVEEKYQGGESYADKRKVETGLWTDLKSMGSVSKVASNFALVRKVAKEKGKPVDDKELVMERLIAMTGALPEDSKQRRILTNTMVDGLWDSLQHPPLSYLGDKYQYRTADGSFNNTINPSMGAAGQPYAKSVRSEKKLHGCPPDPGLLFDLLMARDDATFKENPAGISSMLFYHATIIIHDIFRTNRADDTISDTSSYLDLAPLYGSSVADQMKVRTGYRGQLHPDTFHEKRLIAQPPGVNVILVMYSRFHNYVAEIILKINEKNRFPIPSKDISEDERVEQEKKLDEDLFQTARLIVGGMYINICLHDYLRGLTNTHHSNSSWTLDPRVEIEKAFLSDGTPRGMGNQVSAEFNLLYRFHSVISKRDEEWLNVFLAQEVFPKIGKPLEKLTPKELIEGLLSFESKIPVEPRERTFAGLKRDSKTGKFNDASLVGILKESMEDPAGLFGSRMVPKALRVVEILGILQSRKWGLASLNEFRHFFGLKRHETMDDISSDKHVADTLRQLYDHPDMVELYPGLFLEDAKPALNPGCGGCPPYTVGRGVFSDAVTLVRSDRFYTLDYTSATLTNWGLEEVKQDLKTFGGSMFYKLVHRSFPGWFEYNSYHVMQPMFTRKKNQEIAEELGTAWMFNPKEPGPPPGLKIVADHATIVGILKDQGNFKVPWLKSLNDLMPDKKKNFSDFMLGGDAPGNTEQRKLVHSVLYDPKEFTKILSNAVQEHGKRFLEAETFKFQGEGQFSQIDIIRDVAIPLNARILADIFLLDLKTPENPEGSLNMSSLYKHLVNVRIWGFNNNDIGLAWRRRMWAREGAIALTESTMATVEGVTRDVYTSTPLGFLFGRRSTRPNWAKPGSLRHYGAQVVKKLLEAGKTPAQVSDICWLTALAGVGVPVGVFAEILAFFLKEENIEHWRNVQEFAVQSDSKDEATRAKADKNLRDYVFEAQRLTSSQRNLRICSRDTMVGASKFSRGDIIVTLFGPACKAASNPQCTGVSPEKFLPGERPQSAYIHYGFGPHECLGREICTIYLIGMLKLCAGLKNLRRAPGVMGECKSITLGPANERLYLNDNWSYLTFDPTTWKLHFDGYGRGVWRQSDAQVQNRSEWDIGTIKNDLKKKFHAIAEAKKKAEAEQQKATRGSIEKLSTSSYEYVSVKTSGSSASVYAASNQ